MRGLALEQTTFGGGKRKVAGDWGRATTTTTTPTTTWDVEEAVQLLWVGPAESYLKKHVRWGANRSRDLGL